MAGGGGGVEMAEPPPCQEPWGMNWGDVAPRSANVCPGPLQAHVLLCLVPFDFMVLVLITDMSPTILLSLSQFSSNAAIMLAFYSTIRNIIVFAPPCRLEDPPGIQPLQSVTCPPICSTRTPWETPLSSKTPEWLLGSSVNTLRWVSGAWRKCWPHYFSLM